MKQILKSLLTIVAVAGISGGATYALWTDAATLSGVTYSTGNADLRIANQVTSQWFDNPTIDQFSPAGYYFNIFRFTEEPFYPGKEVTKSMYLGNFSTSHISLDPTMQLTSYSENADGLKYQMEMKVDWGGNATGTGWHDLNYFITSKVPVLDAPLPWDATPGYPNTARYINVTLRMKDTADNSWQDKSASFNILFDATQHL